MEACNSWINRRSCAVLRSTNQIARRKEAKKFRNLSTSQRVHTQRSILPLSQRIPTLPTRTIAMAMSSFYKYSRLLCNFLRTSNKSVFLLLWLLQNSVQVKNYWRNLVCQTKLGMILKSRMERVLTLILIATCLRSLKRPFEIILFTVARNETKAPSSK